MSNTDNDTHECVLRAALKLLVGGADLTTEQATQAAEALVADEQPPALVAALLIALRMKGESVAEIVGFARALRAACTPVALQSQNVVDTCGTGGDASGSFNISTATALLAAAAGAKVAKHGNRAVSSRCGSADVLEALGIPITQTPEAAAANVDERGLGFFFAPAFHPGMRHVASVRRTLGIRSVFNILGPLANPAGARRQVLGVFDAQLSPTLATALSALGSEHCLVVHGHDGLDEITITTRTDMSELRHGEIRRWVLDPRDFGLELGNADALRGGDSAANAAIIERVLAGESPGPCEDIVVLNAGAVLYVAGECASIEAGIERARAALGPCAAKMLAVLREQPTGAAG